MTFKDLSTRLIVSTKKRLYPRILPVQPRSDLIRIGSPYGGWWVPSSILGPDWICVLAGVGEDTTFDLGLIERFGCRVLAVDPTPRSRQHVESIGVPPQFAFVDVGLAGSDRVARFYAPRNTKHVSHSMTNLQSTETYFDARVVCLRTLMAEHDLPRIDLLKLDIEGAEHEVLESLSEPLPKVICVEYDQPEPWRRTRASIEMLRRRGYSLVAVESFNCTFVLDA